MLSVRGQLRSAEVHLARQNEVAWSLDSIPDFSTESSFDTLLHDLWHRKTLRLPIDLDRFIVILRTGVANGCT